MADIGIGEGELLSGRLIEGGEPLRRGGADAKVTAAVIRIASARLPALLVRKASAPDALLAVWLV